MRRHREPGTHGSQDDAKIDVSTELCPEQRRMVGTDPGHKGTPGRAADGCGELTDGGDDREGAPGLDQRKSGHRRCLHRQSEHHDRTPPTPISKMASRNPHEQTDRPGDGESGAHLRCRKVHDQRAVEHRRRVEESIADTVHEAGQDQYPLRPVVPGDARCPAGWSPVDHGRRLTAVARTGIGRIC
ncbi:hypothetical protein GCM10010245_81760 [Streptomyces spectabilis]|nr:hypothetical protein GCM10010245_81760 [Streptomyces spectabilis]